MVYSFNCLLLVPLEKGILSKEVSCEEPIKLAICHLLQHLCDCQVSILTIENYVVL